MMVIEYIFFFFRFVIFKNIYDGAILGATLGNKWHDNAQRLYLLYDKKKTVCTYRKSFAFPSSPTHHVLWIWLGVHESLWYVKFYLLTLKFINIETWLQVTGANKGIGLAIVKELCSKFDGHVYLTSRNESLGLAAVSELKKLGLQPRYHQLDIDDELSVIRLRDYLKTNYGGLDVLVNNAATAFPPSSTKTFQEKAFIVLRTNFFNTHRTCEILFPILRDHARVVNVSSSAGHSSWMPGGTELKKKIISLDLTHEELCNLMQDYVE